MGVILTTLTCELIDIMFSVANDYLSTHGLGTSERSWGWVLLDTYS